MQNSVTMQNSVYTNLSFEFSQFTIWCNFSAVGKQIFLE